LITYLFNSRAILGVDLFIKIIDIQKSIGIIVIVKLLTQPIIKTKYKGITKMNTKTNAITVLDSLNPSHIPVLENHFRAQFISELNKTLTEKLATSDTPDAGEPAGDPVVTPPVEQGKRGRGRPRKNPEKKVEAPAKRRGRPSKSEKTASVKAANVSQVIRTHYKRHPEAPVSDVIAYVEKQGLSCSAPLVYAVRKKMDEATAAEEKAAKAAARAAEKNGKKAAKKSDNGGKKASKKAAKK
jgi:hypothetical protein